MTLVQLLSASRDELEADFQQFYGLDLSRMGDDFTVAHAAVLASQLPREARCLREIDPNLAWSDETAALASIQYLVRCIVWQLGGGKGDKPQPVRTPAQTASLTESLRESERSMAEVAEALGIDA